MTATTVGSVRVRTTNAQESIHVTVIPPIRSEILALGATVTRDRYFVPFQGDRSQPAREDDKILLEYKADSASVVDSGSTILVPVTIRNVNTGEEVPTFLTAADFGITATDIVAGASWTIIGTKTVDAQTAIKLGHKNPANSYMYCSFAYTAD